MKKSAGVILLFGLLALTLFGCGQKAPFPAENAESVEVYRYVVPASAEKKIVTEPEEVEDICEQLIAAGAPEEGEPLAGGTVISFRVNLKDGSPYELVCAENASENLEKYETIWDRIECETAAAEEAELPAGD